jgi:fatty-acyl-CoA synthase
MVIGLEFVQATTIGDLLARAALQWDHEALITPGYRWTFKDFDVRVNEWARALIALNVQAGDKVGILLAQDAEYLAAKFAATRIGAVAVPINARFKGRELLHVICESDMSVLLVSGGMRGSTDFLVLLHEMIPELVMATESLLKLEVAPKLRHIVVFGVHAGTSCVSEGVFWESAKSVSQSEVDVRSSRVAVRDIAIIMYTSGTTSHPKGAMLSHEALSRAAMMVGGTRQYLSSDDVIWSPLPMYHIGGTNFLLCSLIYGAKHVHVGEFNPKMAVQQLDAEGVSVALPGFDLIWMDILRTHECDPTNWKKLRMVMVAVGAPARMMEMQKQVPQAKLVSCYGATESCGFFTYGNIYDSDEIRCDRTGTPLDGLEMRLVDPETGQIVSADKLGEIWYRGYTLFSGYYNNPGATSEAIDAEGWFHSGDLGTVDDHGRLKFVSRLKDMMKVGGENVAAAEIEDFLQLHPDILTAQVVAAPDARYSEVPCAFVVKRPNAIVSADELIHFCRGKISSFKIPRYIRFVEEYPMSGTKVRKHELRARIAEELLETGITEAPKLR